MRRRNLLLDGTVAIGLGLTSPELALEITRHDLTPHPPAEREPSTPDEWDEIVADHAVGYMTRPPTQLLTDLSLDLTTLNHVLRTQTGGGRTRGLCRAGATLAVLTAMTQANLGALGQARRWWRTAKGLAHQSGDSATIVWVRGREIVRAPYEGFPLPGVLDLIQRAEPIADHAPQTAIPQFASGKAQALAMAGKADEARAALARVQELTERLPGDATRDNGSILDYPETCLHFTTSLVHSHLGDYAQADQAQQAALGTYPPTARRRPAQIELQRALCLVRAGDVDVGANHAIGVLDGLAPADRIRPVVDLAGRVAHGVPPGHRSRPAASLRELLAAVAQGRT